MSSKKGDSGLLFSRKQFLWLLWALVLLRLLLNVVVPLMDPSEARYALICKLMTETNNFLEPKLIHDGVLMNFEGKPPLYFQAGALACHIFGIDLFALGDTGKKEGEIYKTIEVDDPRLLTYRKFYFLHDVFAGAVVIGDTSCSGKVLEAYQNKADVETTLALLHKW